MSRVKFAGFRIARTGAPGLIRPPDIEVTRQYVRDCPFVDESCLETANVDYREPFLGHDYYLDLGQAEINGLEEALQRS